MDAQEDLNNNDGTINETQMAAIERLREDLSEELVGSNYDTDFNLLRWLKAYGFKHEEVI